MTLKEILKSATQLKLSESTIINLLESRMKELDLTIAVMELRHKNAELKREKEANKRPCGCRLVAKNYTTYALVPKIA